ncbi:MAG: hypothetical protein KA248_00230 [Kiritimatiellae bacterium]|nr:hypothetical protein [Kiritimatiellia bacterium]
MNHRCGSLTAVAAGLVVSLLLFSACDPLSRPPPETALPADFELRWSSGATHAEWGRKEGTLNAQGELVWVESRGSGDEATRTERRGQASREQLDALWRAIQEHRFFNLREQYSNPGVRDGFSSFIAVQAGGREHSVAVMNTRQERFSEVMKVLDAIRREVIPEEPETD